VKAHKKVALTTGKVLRVTGAAPAKSGKHRKAAATQDPELAAFGRAVMDHKRRLSDPVRQARFDKLARSGSHRSREIVLQVINCREALRHYLEQATGGGVARDEVTRLLYEALACGPDWLELHEGETLPERPAYRFPDDPRRLYSWRDLNEKGTDIVDKVAELRKQAMGLFAAAGEEDHDSVGSYFADIAKGLDDVEEHAQSVTFMAERHAEFVAAHPEEFPVETYGVDGTPAEKAKVAS
jgi:hypothetical protein